MYCLNSAEFGERQIAHTNLHQRQIFPSPPRTRFCENSAAPLYRYHITSTKIVQFPCHKSRQCQSNFSGGVFMSKKKRHLGLLVISSSLVLCAGALFAGRHVILEEVRTKAATEIGKRVLMEQLNRHASTAGQASAVSQVVENMEQEDVETLTGIAEKYISQDNLKQAADLVANGDMEGLKELAQEQVTEEDQARLEELYDKYKDKISGYVP